MASLCDDDIGLDPYLTRMNKTNTQILSIDGVVRIFSRSVPHQSGWRGIFDASTHQSGLDIRTLSEFPAPII
jgi:hypothetical protein